MGGREKKDERCGGFEMWSSCLPLLYGMAGGK